MTSSLLDTEITAGKKDQVRRQAIKCRTLID